MPRLETISLTRRFDTRIAVDQLGLVVEAREIFGLLGPNGAGKTTTLKMLTTLLPPTSGTARVAGYDIVTEAATVRRVMGYVPQLVSADGLLTGYENLLIFAKLYDVPRAEREARIREALVTMDLEAAGDRLVQQYSGGMVRRLEIAQAMLHRPSILFLDEPTVGLDPIARSAVWDHIERLRDTIGTTIVFTTHSMEEADEHCSRVAILHQGRIVALGSPSELKAALGVPGATLEDVFVQHAGPSTSAEGTFRETIRSRRNTQRLG